MEYIDYNLDDMHPAFEYSEMRCYRDYTQEDTNKRDEILKTIVLDYASYMEPEWNLAITGFMDRLILDIILAQKYFENLEEYELCKLFLDLYNILVEAENKQKR